MKRIYQFAMPACTPRLFPLLTIWSAIAIGFTPWTASARVKNSDSYVLKEQKLKSVLHADQLSSGPALTLSDFLGQVAEKHDGYRAADKSQRSAVLTSTESSLIFKPAAFANVQYSSDGISNPFAKSDKLHLATYVAGVQDTTRFGLLGKVSYIRNEIATPAIPPFSPAATNYNSSWLQLDVTQSLWRNWDGRETRAQEEVAHSGSLASAFSQTYAGKQLLLQAESAYWQLALSREMVQVQMDAVARAKRIKEWTERRVRLNLVDRAESIQSSANLESSLLNLRTTQDNMTAAAQTFNASRGVDAELVSEKLVDLAPNLIADLSQPARSVVRDDVKAAEFQAESSGASAKLSREKNKPTVELFATTPLTHPTGDQSSIAAQQLPISARPATTIGVRLSAPLDFETLSHDREGYDVAAEAADLRFQRARFDERRDWDTLATQFHQAQERLKLYLDLEKTQQEKLAYQRDLQTRGRSTLEQVWLYEADYQSAQTGRIQTLAQLLNLNAQMKLYGVSYESR